jgi:hypothetical protein
MMILQIRKLKKFPLVTFLEKYCSHLKWVFGKTTHYLEKVIVLM